MSVRVDFCMDEFNKIWLMQADKLFIRRKRKVPIEGNTLLADYIIRTMRRIEMTEQQAEMRKEIDAA